jgi:hypothetical protein
MVFAGERLQNYHIGFDLLIALISKTTFIPVHTLYFQIIPILLAILIGTLSYLFILNWKDSSKAALWSTFFVYFGGSFSWILGKGESAFWSQQAVTTLINPPFAMSLVFILAGLLTLQKIVKKYSLKLFLLTVILFGTLIEIKAYAGVLCLGGLFVVAIYNYFQNRSVLFLKIFIASLILSVILYVPLNKASAGLLVFQPFWFLESLMGLTDRLNFQRFYSAMLNYRSGQNYLKMIPAYIVAFGIFLIGNFGTRAIGGLWFLTELKNIKKLNSFSLFIMSVISAGILIPMLFLQKGTPWNTIQFFYYSLFLLSFVAGVVVSRLNSIALILLILLTVPTTYITLKEVYIPGRPPSKIAREELEALKFLSGQPEGTVLTKPFDEFKAKAAENDPPRPLYLYESTAYVSAFSKKPTFLEDEVNLDITGYEWDFRRDLVLGWYEEKDYSVARSFLRENGIKYVYWIKEGQSPLDLEKMGVVNLYENSFVTIYKVN